MFLYVPIATAVTTKPSENLVVSSSQVPVLASWLLTTNYNSPHCIFPITSYNFMLHVNYTQITSYNVRLVQFLNLVEQPIHYIMCQKFSLNDLKMSAFISKKFFTAAIRNEISKFCTDWLIHHISSQKLPNSLRIYIAKHALWIDVLIPKYVTPPLESW